MKPSCESHVGGVVPTAPKPVIIESCVVGAGGYGQKRSNKNPAPLTRIAALFYLPRAAKGRRSQISSLSAFPSFSSGGGVGADRNQVLRGGPCVNSFNIKRQAASRKPGGVDGHPGKPSSDRDSQKTGHPTRSVVQLFHTRNLNNSMQMTRRAAMRSQV